MGAYNRAVAAGNLTVSPIAPPPTDIESPQLDGGKFQVSQHSEIKTLSLKIFKGPEADRLKIIADAAVNKAKSDKAAADKAAADAKTADKAAADAKTAADKAVADAKTAADAKDVADKAAADAKTAADKAAADSEKAKADADKAKADADKAKADATVAQSAAASAAALAAAKLMAAQAADQIARNAKKTLASLKAKIKSGSTTPSANATASRAVDQEPTPNETGMTMHQGGARQEVGESHNLLPIGVPITVFVGTFILLRFLRKKLKSSEMESANEEISVPDFFEFMEPKSSIAKNPKKMATKKAPVKKKVAAAKTPAKKKTAPKGASVTKKAAIAKKSVAKKRAQN